MPVERGLVLDGYRSLRAIFEPLAAELARCFLLVDVQAGPFDLWSGGRFEDNMALIDGQLWDVPVLENRSTAGLRPGAIPQLTDRINVDEWSYYFAIDASETEALARAGVIADHIGDLSEPFLRDLDCVADLFICHAEGWWEFYCGRPDWCDRLVTTWPDCIARPLGRAGTPPPRSAA
jgi:hypothetical protein